MLTNFLHAKLSTSKSVSRLSDLAESYVREHLGINDTSTDYSTSVDKAERDIRNFVQQQNAKFSDAGKLPPFQITGKANNLIRAGETLPQIVAVLSPVSGDPNDFADDVGRKILLKLGCAESDCHITPITGDEGIDYWGIINLQPHDICSPSCKLLVIGQVKQYNGSVPVEHIRAFFGAVHSSLINGILSRAGFSPDSPKILHFVTTGNITEAGKSVLKNCKIHLIGKHHLVQMGFVDLGTPVTTTSANSPATAGQ